MDASIIMNAAVFATMAHYGQTDRAGKAYILHPLNVAQDLEERGYGTQFIVAALLHDVAEDTDCTIEDVAGPYENTRWMDIAEAIRLLTHDKDVPYMEYIEKLKDNEIARVVKMADLRHNMDMSRLPRITGKDRERLAKYQEAYELLARNQEGTDDSKDARTI